MCLAEELADPTLRSWQIIKAKKTGDNYLAYYTPFHESEMVVMYGIFKYANGFTICSKIIAKKFTKEEVTRTYKNNLVYSSRFDNADTLFANKDTLEKKGELFLMFGILKWGQAPENR